MQIDLNLAFSVIGYSGFIIGGILYARSKVPNQTITNYKLLSESQDKRIKGLEDQSKIDQKNHMDNIKAIADLQGQIKVYKELPLQEMAAAMQKMSTVNEGIAKSNELILAAIRSSNAVTAATLAHDTAVVLQNTQTVANDLKDANRKE